MSTADPQPPETKASLTAAELDRVKENTMPTPPRRRRLRATVHVRTDEGFGCDAEVFNAGDEPPEWAAKKITNPKAWDDWTGTDAADLYLADTTKPHTPTPPAPEPETT